MKLERLTLTNFRGFSSFEISFDPSFTVLLGENMAGKSAVLDGAAIALCGLLGDAIDRNRRVRPYRCIEDVDIRRTVAEIEGVPDLQLQLPVAVGAEAQIDFGEGPRHMSWTQAREGVDASDLGPTVLIPPYPTYLLRSVDLPVIATYGTRRSWQPPQTDHEQRGVGSRYDGYDGCFDVVWSQLLLAAWLRKQTLVQLQRGAAQPQLAAVEAAIKSCIAEVRRFWFDVQYDELRLERNGGDIQSFTMLSEGYRNLVAMVADIAWRAAVLNPQHGVEAHLRTSGVVLVDELDLHLHPAWQRRVVADLRRTFPNVQFIVSTHSPQIVASVDRDQIRLLDRNRLVAERPHVEGRDSNAILEDVFDVASRPEEVQGELDVLFRLIEDERFSDARTKLQALEERLGPDDAEMIRARWILDTEAGAANGRPPTSP